jgi:DNA-binding CsgD family transcriptional regulator
MLFFVNNVFKGDVGGDRILVGIENVASNDSIAEQDLISVQDLREASIFHQKDSIQPIIINTQTNAESHSAGNQTLLILFWSAIGILSLIISYLLYLVIRSRRSKNMLKQQIKSIESRYLLKIDNLEKNIKDKIHHQDDLGKELKFRQNEMVTMAMSIIHKNEFLNDLKEEVLSIKSDIKDHDTRLGLNKLSLMITQDLSIDRDREKFQMHISEQNSNFIHRISEAFPAMTENEKRLAVLLRLNLSSKEIASILNISPKSVEMNRYRLRKKLKVPHKMGLIDFIREF